MAGDIGQARQKAAEMEGIAGTQPQSLSVRFMTQEKQLYAGTAIKLFVT